MALTVTTNKIDEVIVVCVNGVSYFGEESASLRIHMKDLLDQSRQIVLDLGNVTHIDSGSVGTLVAVHSSARKVGGNVKFANLGDHTREVLQITKLVRVFEIFETVEDAVASFKRAATAI